MTTWNYRVIKYEARTPPYDVEYHISEIYYRDGHISMWSRRMMPSGETLEELRSDLNLMMEATYKPVIDEKDLPGE